MSGCCRFADRVPAEGGVNQATLDRPPQSLEPLSALPPRDYSTLLVSELHTHLAGKKVILLWDRLRSHRSKTMEVLPSHRSGAGSSSRPCPPTLLKLNPVEKLWSNPQ